MTVRPYIHVFPWLHLSALKLGAGLHMLIQADHLQTFTLLKFRDYFEFCTIKHYIVSEIDRLWFSFLSVCGRSWFGHLLVFYPRCSSLRQTLSPLVDFCTMQSNHNTAAAVISILNQYAASLWCIMQVNEMRWINCQDIVHDDPFILFIHIQIYQFFFLKIHSSGLFLGLLGNILFLINHNGYQIIKHSIHLMKIWRHDPNLPSTFLNELFNETVFLRRWLPRSGMNFGPLRKRKVSNVQS